uniref:AMP-dependent synthetase/ligase domain-containing protein n=1 Tax=Alexandrium monilatum TaxID=311494 RepID=A0A7S4SJ49_9DINO
MAATDPRDHFPLLLHALCDRGARMQPDNLIITKTSAGYNTLTFQEHQARALRLASALDKWGVQVGDRVATMLWNTSWHLQCYHAISCMGAVLHTLNLRLGAQDLAFTIRHAADRVIIVDGTVLEALARVESPVLESVELYLCAGDDGVPGKWALPPAIPRAKTQDFEAFLSTGSETFLWPLIPETSPHALCYTSGTTGVPKGVAYSQRSTYLHTLASCGADQLGIRGSEVVLPFVPMFHVLSWGVPFVLMMLGTRTVFSGRFMDADSLLDCMLDWGVHFSLGVPTVWRGVRQAIEKRGVASVAGALKLRTLTCGGSAPPPEMMAWFGDELSVEFVQGWGMTETNPLGCLGRRVARHRDLSKGPEELLSNTSRAGLLLPGVDARVADPGNLDRDMPQGRAGELLVRGPWVIQEYFQCPAPDKFHRGWLVTGDVARIDEEGAIVISDRSKDVIKSGGEWISSIDLENHITAMDGIAMAAVVAVPHPRWDERPLAAVVLEPGVSRKGLKQRIDEHCLKRFARFQLPDDVVVWAEIPLTSMGKIDKAAIRERLRAEAYVLPTAKL